MTTMIDKGGTPQQLRALEKANRIRIANRELKSNLEAMGYQQARLHVADLLQNSMEEHVAAMPVERLLRSMPKHGKKKAAWMLKQIGVNTVDRRVRDLTPRQREWLADELLGARRR